MISYKKKIVNVKGIKLLIDELHIPVNIKNRIVCFWLMMVHDCEYRKKLIKLLDILWYI